MSLATREADEHPELGAGYKFTVESGNEIGLGDGGVAQKNRKFRMLTKPQIKLFEDNLGGWLLEASRAKYRASQAAPEGTVARKPAEVLLVTGDAQLIHYVRGKGDTRFLPLETVRQELREGRLE